MATPQRKRNVVDSMLVLEEDDENDGKEGGTKRKSYTNQQKVQLVEKYQQSGQGVVQFAQRAGINRSQLAKWIKKYDALKKAVQEGRGKHAKTRKLQFPLTDAAVHAWYLQTKQTGMPMTDLIVVTKAVELAQMVAQK